MSAYFPRIQLKEETLKTPPVPGRQLSGPSFQIQLPRDGDLLSGYGRWMIDVCEWVTNFTSYAERVKSSPRVSFFDYEVARPIHVRELAGITESLDCGIPPLLREFYTLGAAGLSARLRIPRESKDASRPLEKFETGEPPAFESSFQIIPPERLKKERGLMIETADELESLYGEDSGFAALAPFMRTCLPFVISSDCGNRFVLDVESDPIDPAVYWWVMLETDGVFLLDHSLEHFLIQWEKLRYVNEDGWPLLHYVDEKRGLVPSEGETARIDSYIFD